VEQCPRVARCYLWSLKRNISCARALPSRSRGPEQTAVKAACDDLGAALIAYSPLALGVLAAVLYGPISFPRTMDPTFLQLLLRCANWIAAACLCC
jgi:hypothetical protein